MGVRGWAWPVGGAGPAWGGASPKPAAENLTTKGSRLKTSSGSGYWYESTTDTESFLGQKEGGHAVLVTSCPSLSVPAPHL